MSIVIDGVVLNPPMVLACDEVHVLAQFNADRARGDMPNRETLRRMEMLQLRFDWLGYLTEDGEAHAGCRALPAVITVKRSRWTA